MKYIRNYLFVLLVNLGFISSAFAANHHAGAATSENSTANMICKSFAGIPSSVPGRVLPILITQMNRFRDFIESKSGWQMQSTCDSDNRLTVKLTLQASHEGTEEQFMGLSNSLSNLYHNQSMAPIVMGFEHSFNKNPSASDNQAMIVVIIKVTFKNL